MQLLRLERWAALAGVVTAVLWIGATLTKAITTDVPGDAPTADELAAYYRAEAGGLELSVWIFLLGVFAFPWFVAALYGAVRGAEAGGRWLGAVVLVSGSALLVAMTGTRVCDLAAATMIEPELLGPENAVVFWGLCDGFWLASAYPFAALLAAIGIAALNGIVFPQWVGWVGLALAVVLLVEPIAAMVVPLAILWLAVVSVVLFLRTSRPPATPA